VFGTARAVEAAGSLAGAQGPAREAPPEESPAAGGGGGGKKKKKGKNKKNAGAGADAELELLLDQSIQANKASQEDADQVHLLKYVENLQLKIFEDK